MKKLLIPLLCMSLLTGCEIVFPDEIEEQPKQQEQEQTQPENNNQPSSPTDNNSQIPADNNQSSNGNENSNTTDNNGGNEQVPVGVTKKTVTFYNGSFTSSTLDQQQSQNDFVSWFNGTDNVLTSIGYSGFAQINYIGDEKDDWRFSTLILGSQNDTGEITFNFRVDVSAVKVVVQPYTKYISYNNTYSMDKNSVFILNDEEHSLSVDENYTGETERSTFEKTFTGGTRTIKIANKENRQRVFVHSLEITYWGN